MRTKIAKSKLEYYEYSTDNNESILLIIVLILQIFRSHITFAIFSFTKDYLIRCTCCKKNEKIIELTQMKFLFASLQNDLISSLKKYALVT